MTSTHHPPLSYEASATTIHPSVSPSLPPEVVACLKNSRFVRLYLVVTTAYLYLYLYR